MKILKYTITNNSFGNVDSLIIDATLKTESNNIFHVRVKESEAPKLYKQLFQAISNKINNIDDKDTDVEFIKMPLMSEKGNLKQKPKDNEQEESYRDKRTPINYDVNPEKIMQKVLDTNGKETDYQELKSDINVGKPDVGREPLSEADFTDETIERGQHKKEEFVSVDDEEESDDGLIPDEGDDEDEAF